MAIHEPAVQPLEGAHIAVSVDEAQLLLACIRETEEALEEVEYELLPGVPHQAIRELRQRLDDRIRAAQRAGWTPPHDAADAIVPHDRWLVIVTYRVFHDVPRLILATDCDSRFWLLLSAFDDARDDYAPDYTILYAGRDLAAARAAFGHWCADQPTGLGAAVAQHPVAHVEFDPTLRHRLKLTIRNPTPA